MKKPILTLLLLALSVLLGAQESIKEVAPCVDSLLNSIRTSTSYFDMEIHFSEAYIVLKRKRDHHFVKDPAVIQQLPHMDKSSARAYQISSLGKTIYALSYHKTDTAKLDTNYTTWILLDNELQKTIHYTSLSPNPRLIYFHKDTLDLHFARIFYGTNYYWTRDDNQMDFMIDLSQIKDGVPIRLMLKDSLCK